VEKVIENWEVETTKRAKELGFANSGDIVVFTQGPSSGKPGGTNMLKILSLD
jgi:pyruvate kinase